MTEVVRSNRLQKKQNQLLVIGVVVMIILCFMDLAEDFVQGEGWEHIGVELLTFLIGFGILLSLWLKANRYWHSSTSELGQSLDSSRSEVTLWKTEAARLKAGIAESIHKQFSAWGFTESERDIGLLLVKGFSLKEIAEFRGTSERTVRTQAAAIYRKSNLENRSQLSAFFLEDLLGADINEATQQ